MISKLSWSKAVVATVLTGTFLMLAACGSPSAPPTAPPAPAKPAKEAVSNAAPAVENKGEQVVANFNFSDWEGAAPRRWTAEPADKVAKSVGTTPQSVYVELKPSGTEKVTTVRQRFSGNLAGKTLTLTMRAKALEDKMLSGKFSFETGKGVQTVVLDADGNGAWRSVTKEIAVPADAKAGTGVMSIVLRSGATKPALVDYVAVTAK